MHQPTAQSLTRTVWIAILCGGAIMAITVGLRQSFGLFLTPVSLDLGLGRGVFALAMALMNLVWGLLAPFAGAVADRYGPGRVAAAGGLAYAGGLALMTRSGDGTELILGGLLLGVGLGGAGFTVVLGAVGRAAPAERRGMALGLASMGGSLGQFLALPYAQALIEGFGWLVALLVLAATALAVVPLARGISGPRAEPMAAAAPQGTQGAGAALREAAGHPGFRLLTAGFFVCGFHLAFVAVHLPAFLADRGMAPWLGAAALTLVGLCNILGTYLCGWFGDRRPRKQVLAALYLGRAAIFLGFILVPVSPASVLVFGALMGFLWLGTVPLTSGLVAYIFGPAHMSMLFGIVFLSHQLGGFTGAWLAGYLYEAFGSYDAMWWLSVVLGVASAALHWPIAERPIERSVARPAAAG